MSDSKTCINCQKEVIGKYCHTCGQKYGVVRLTWRSMFDDLQQRLFGFDNNFFRTVRDLTIRPHKVIQSILDGIRVVYIGPVGFYFLMLTVYLLLASILDVDLREMMEEAGQSMGAEEQSEGQATFNNDYLTAVSDNFRIFSFLTVPFFVLGNALFYRKLKMNLVEHSVVVFYALGWPFLTSCIFIALYRFLDFSPNLWTTSIVVVYYAWVCTMFYSKNRILGFFKGVLVVFFSYLIMIVVIALSLFGYLLLNPDVAKQFVPK